MNSLLSKMRSDPEYRIRIAYRTALLSMMALLWASFLILTFAMNRGQSESVVFQDIAKQRMLSQRVVLLGQLALRATSDEQKSEILVLMGESLTELESAHTDLAKMIGSQDTKGAVAETLQDVYFSNPTQLDLRMRSLVTNANRFRKFLMTSPDIATLYLGPMEELASSMILPALDRVISIHNGVSQKSTAMTKYVHLALLLLSLALLSVIWQFLFKPLAAKIGMRTMQLQVAHDNLQYAVLHDSLTGLANREYAMTKLQSITETSAKESPGKLAVLHMDLDNFKSVNDTYGHTNGDRLLELVANRMQAVVGNNGTACRMNGDEFLIILDTLSASETVSGIAGKLLDALNKPANIDGLYSLVQTSIGIASFPEDGKTCEDLLIAADLALYEAKNSGKGTYKFFKENMVVKYNQSKTLEQEIDRAIEERQFQPVFQPQINATSGAIIGVEVLVRWHHPDRGILLPAEFLDAAASLGKMTQMTRIVLEQAFEVAARWLEEGTEFGRIGINFSNQDLLLHGFVDEIAEIAKASGLTCERLSAEIVESVVINNDDTQCMTALMRLRELGIKVEIDDFGTGFATMVHLNRKIFDRVKIDRQFITNIDQSERNRIIVDSIIRLSTALGLGVIAEGMERQEEIDTLMELGCVEFQGNAIALPMPANIAGTWLKAHNKTALPRRHSNETATASTAH